MRVTEGWFAGAARSSPPGPGALPPDVQARRAATAPLPAAAFSRSYHRSNVKHRSSSQADIDACVALTSTAFVVDAGSGGPAAAAAHRRRRRWWRRRRSRGSDGGAKLAAAADDAADGVAGGATPEHTAVEAVGAAGAVTLVGNRTDCALLLAMRGWGSGFEAIRAAEHPNVRPQRSQRRRCRCRRGGHIWFRTAACGSLARGPANTTQ